MRENCGLFDVKQKKELLKPFHFEPIHHTVKEAINLPASISRIQKVKNTSDYFPGLFVRRKAEGIPLKFNLPVLISAVLAVSQQALHTKLKNIQNVIFENDHVQSPL